MYRKRVENAWKHIDDQVQTRHDLVTSLMKTAKEYIEDEKSCLKAVTKARNEAIEVRESILMKGFPYGGAIKKLMVAEGNLMDSLGNLIALGDKYPQLYKSENIQQLQDKLTSTENKVTFLRQVYNEQVIYYNHAQKRFPALIFTAMLGHQEADFFEVEDEEA